MSIFDGILINTEQPFTLHSGGTSPVKFDVTQMLYDVQTRDYIAQILVNNTRQIASDLPQVVVGIETGGAYCALLLLDYLRRNMNQGPYFGIVNKDGTCTLPQTTGDVVPCLLVDDVVTTGNSFDEAGRILAALGYLVAAKTFVVDRRRARAFHT